MTEFRFPHISRALPELMSEVLFEGDEMSSRAGRVKEIRYAHIVLEEPCEREVLTQHRRVSLPAQIAETMWVLAGRRDVKFLAHYLPRAADFSDDGISWRAGYGPRIRSWVEGTDQLDEVVRLLKDDHDTRRAVINIFDPAEDFGDSKDIPCNNWLHFLIRDGKLSLHIATRSNDLMWGWSGINAFEWSVLMEVVAGLVGVEVGEMHFSISSLHLYEPYWNKAGKIAGAGTENIVDSSPRFDLAFVEGKDLQGFDELVTDWFYLEERIRKAIFSATDWSDLDFAIDNFPEPMLRSWLQVIAWWWTGEERHLKPLTGTALEASARLSPGQPAPPKTFVARRAAALAQYEGGRFSTEEYTGSEAADTLAAFTGGTPGTAVGTFLEFVCSLHKEKHEVYGDSWKRRGEQIGILANIARKVDRLGVAGGGDTASDTVIDLLCYLVKYRLWLSDEHGIPAPRPLADRERPAVLSDESWTVSEVLSNVFPGSPAHPLVKDPAKVAEWLTACFGALEQEVRNHARVRSNIVDQMIPVAYALAEKLWVAEQPVTAGVTNATRKWAGYGDAE